MSLRRIRFAIPALSAAAILGLGACNLLLSETAIDIAPIAVAPLSQAKIETQAAAKADDAVQPGQGSQALSRPLFSPTRREYEPPPVPVAPPAEIAPLAQPAVVPIPSFRLIGIRRTGPEAAALLSVSPDQKAQWSPVGAIVEGWTLERVDSHSVALRFADQSTVVDLYSPENAHAPGN